MLQAHLLRSAAYAFALGLPGSSQGYMYTNTTAKTGFAPCDALVQAGLEDRLLLPGDIGYETQIETWFAVNTRRRPWCLVLPHTTEEVSSALAALSNAGPGAGDWHIAIRSGGHSIDETNNIANGVTIDLSNMNHSNYDPATNLASIEPGGRWKNVYADLLEQGVTVTGGRDGGVGVGGFLLGGGNSFYTARTGLGCDSVINYEVVLADGSIINANSDENSDLWKALKGGSSNFGIITRFSLEAFPAQNISHGVRVMSPEYSDPFLDAIVDFTNQDESFADDALVPFYAYGLSGSVSTMLAIRVNTRDNSNTTSFNKIDQIPALAPGPMRSISMADAALGSQLEAGTRNAGFTLTFKNDIRILQHCVDLYNQYIEDLQQSIDPESFLVSTFFQPFPRYFADIGQRRGGNVLGLDRNEHNSILWVFGVALKGGDDQRSLAHAKAGALVANVKAFAKSIDGDSSLVYLNYADASQDAIGSYGVANVQHIRDVAAKYDPTGFFQDRVPGGFKVSRVA